MTAPRGEYAARSRAKSAFVFAVKSHNSPQRMETVLSLISGLEPDRVLYIMKKSTNKKLSQFSVELDREKDGRWIAEVPKVPGAMAYGSTRQEAVRRAYAIALRTLADSLEQGRGSRVVSRLLEHAMAHR